MSLASRIISDPYQKLTKTFVVSGNTRRFLSVKEDADLGLLQAAYLQEQPYKPQVGSLFERAQAGDQEAVEALVEEHKGIVHFCIGRMRSLINHYDCEAEAVSIGFQGLMRAIYGFDDTKGKFASAYLDHLMQRDAPSHHVPDEVIDIPPQDEYAHWFSARLRAAIAFLG
jgi:hypothetical protein